MTKTLKTLTSKELAAADARAFDLLTQAEEVLRGRLEGTRVRGADDDGVYRERFDALDSIRKAMQRIAPEKISARFSLSQEEEKTWKDSIVERHESYGVVAVTRPTGRRRLVGSMLDSLPTFVELVVKRARRDIDPSSFVEHYFHEGPQIVRIAMSTTQFADLITSMNGVEVPCTLQTVMGARMDPVPEDVKTPLDQVAFDTRNEMIRGKDKVEENFLKEVNALRDQIKASKLSKKAQTELLKTLGGIEKLIHAPRSTAAWAAQRVAEVTEAAAAQGRMEMAAALASLVRRSGLKAIGDKLAEHIGLQLTEGEDVRPEE